jgi:hypothetical protein
MQKSHMHFSPICWVGRALGKQMQTGWKLLGFVAALGGAGVIGLFVGRASLGGRAPQGQPVTNSHSAAVNSPPRFIPAPTSRPPDQPSDCLLVRDGRTMTSGPCTTSETSSRLTLSTGAGRMVIREAGEDDIYFEASFTNSAGRPTAIGEVRRLVGHWSGEGPIQPITISGRTYGECYESDHWQICTTIRNRVRADRVGHWIPIG